MTRHAAFALFVTLVAMPALAVEMPSRKAGLWEVQTPGSSGAFRQCIDATTDQILQARGGAAIGPAGPSPQCAKRDVQKSGETITIDATCTTAGKTLTSHAAVTGSFDRAYTMIVTTQGDGIPGGTRTMTVTAKWLGPCAADQKPGDMIMPNGTKLNILTSRSAASPARRRRHRASFPPLRAGRSAPPALLAAHSVLMLVALVDWKRVGDSDGQ